MTKPYIQPGEPLNEFLRSFWQRQIDAAEQETPDYRHPPLPLARIKKVMKSDPDVKVSNAFGIWSILLWLNARLMSYTS
jgi:nuclear transcription factor Y, gamma